MWNGNDSLPGLDKIVAVGKMVIGFWQM